MGLVWERLESFMRRQVIEQRTFTERQAIEQRNFMESQAGIMKYQAKIPFTLDMVVDKLNSLELSVSLSEVIEVRKSTARSTNPDHVNTLITTNSAVTVFHSDRKTHRLRKQNFISQEAWNRWEAVSGCIKFQALLLWQPDWVPLDFNPVGAHYTNSNKYSM